MKRADTAPQQVFCGAVRRVQQEGIEQGFSEGSYQTKLETAKLMRMHNYPIAEICMMTGLSKEEIENI